MADSSQSTESATSENETTTSNSIESTPSENETTTGSATSENGTTTGSATSENGTTTGNSGISFSGLSGENWDSLSSGSANVDFGLTWDNWSDSPWDNWAGSFWDGWGALDSGSANGDSPRDSGDSLDSDNDSNDSSSPMTVDEVYGNGNQPIVESQGDYAASSNEKSDVETSTLGKQDSITVTPDSVAESKGLVDNSAIDSIEGLNFQQKDKESQDVLEAKKSRDDAEAEDKANQMRDSLKATTDKSINRFHVGNDDIDNIYKRVSEESAKDVKSKSDTLTQKTNDLKDAEAKRSAAEAMQNNLFKAYKESESREADVKNILAYMNARMQELRASNPLVAWATEHSDSFKNLKDDLADIAEPYVDIGDVSKMGIKDTKAAVEKVNRAVSDHYSSKTKEALEKLQYANKDKEDAELVYNNALKEHKDAKDAYDNALRTYNNISANKSAFRDSVKDIKGAYEKGEMTTDEAVNRLQNMALMDEYSPLGLKTADMVYLAGGLDGKYLASNPSALQGRYVGAPATKVATVEAPATKVATVEAPATKVATVEAPATKVATVDNTPSDIKQGFDEAIQNAVEKGADEKTVQEMTDAAAAICQSRDKVKDAIEKGDIPTYIETQKQYNKILEDALKIDNSITQTDYNKDFVTAVAKANDFDVTLADGTKTTYSQFATEMVTKSPEIAKAMYESKAQKYEDNGHPFLAKIERIKADMSQTWLGSKLTLADNQARNQFHQMAKTDMRATYAAYNDTLNNPNATPEQKAEASAAINQANGLMTASAALQASTGFLSGIGDSMKDGVYGVTVTDATALNANQKTLNAYQKTLNTASNFAKIVLGLGITPGANEAYQNMYYMSGAKVNESGLFSKDFDKDGFALCQEYGNNAAVGMIAGAGELATGVALFFNPATSGIGLNLTIDSIKTFTNGLYGVQKDARKSQRYTQEVLGYFKEAESIVAETGNKEATEAISDGITQIENFELKSDEVGNLDNWLEGSGSNTATNEKFNQSLSYDEWLKLIEADPTMRDYAKKLIAEKKEK